LTPHQLGGDTTDGNSGVSDIAVETTQIFLFKNQQHGTTDAELAQTPPVPIRKRWFKPRIGNLTVTFKGTLFYRIVPYTNTQYNHPQRY
jgi:hypothetical protein